MIWVRSDRILPPSDILIYVWRDNEVEVRKFTSEEVAEFQRILGLTEEQKAQEKEARNDEYLCLDIPFEGWSYIPLIPPDELMPILGGITQQVLQLQLDIQNLKAELASIPRISSFQAQLHDLQRQVAAARPDAYHQWKERRLKEPKE